MRRLFFDIETAPNIVLSWRLGRRIDIDYQNLLKERAIICIGYKWEGEKAVHVVTWDKNQCDKEALATFVEVLKEADEIVGHNIDRFDLPWVKTRCLFHQLPPLPHQIKTVDTLQWAKRYFYFNSNRLDYIAKFLGIGAKVKTEFNLWKTVVLDKNNSALKKMKRYCQHDVALLEKVWRTLHLMSPVKTHAGVMQGNQKWACNRCGSKNVKKKQQRITAAGTYSRQFQCNECGGYFTINGVSEKAYDKASKKN